MNDDGNIIQFGSIAGGKEDKEEFPDNPYVLVDIEGEEWYGRGYLIFTTHHVAIMEDTPKGAMVGVMLPLHRLKAASLVDEEDGTVH